MLRQLGSSPPCAALRPSVRRLVTVGRGSTRLVTAAQSAGAAGAILVVGALVVVVALICPLKLCEVYVASARAPSAFLLSLGLPPINAKIQKFKKWEAIVMSFKEEFAEAQRRFGLLGFYDKFEYVVILLLTALIAVFIVFALWNVALKIFLSIAASSFDPTDYVVFQAVFGMIFTVIIALEFKRSLLVVAERQHSVVQVRTVLLIALLAIVRKLLILDVGRGAEELFALAAAIIALGAVYWLVRDQDRSELRERRTVEEAERVSRLAGERDSTEAGNDS
jgi:uncharacterized membrane protein (DUF373 family)